MDYTGFVRYYYVSLINKLNKYSSYKGTTTILNYPLGISEENLHVVDSVNFDGLPTFGLNINAPTEDYETFLEYYGKVMLDLSILFVNKTILREIYSEFVFNSEDEMAKGRVDLYIETVIKDLVEQGIIR